MNTTDDRFWDDLGVAWRAVEIPHALLMPRLRKKLNRETWRQRVSYTLSAIAGFCGIAFGAWFFIKSRQLAGKWIGVIVWAATAAAIALDVWKIATPTSGDTLSLMGMIDLSISRAKRQQRAAKTCYAGCIIVLLADALILYLGFSHLHIHLVRWRAVVIAFAIVFLIGLACYGYRLGRTSREREARFRHLKRVLSATDGVLEP